MLRKVTDTINDLVLTSRNSWFRWKDMQVIAVQWNKMMWDTEKEMNYVTKNT